MMIRATAKCDAERAPVSASWVGMLSEVKLGKTCLDEGFSLYLRSVSGMRRSWSRIVGSSPGLSSRLLGARGEGENVGN